MRPKSITYFQICAWTAIGMSLLALLVVAAIVSAVPVPGGAGGTVILVLLIPLLLLAGLGVTVYLAAQKRNGVARWIYIGLAALMILLSLVGLAGGGANAIAVLLNLIQDGLLVGSIVFLLLPDSSAWFAGAQGHNPGYGGGYAPAPAYLAQSGGSWGTAPPPQAPPGGYVPATPPPPPPPPVASPPPAQAYAPEPAPTPAPEPAPATAGTRACPYCAEEIKAEAIKCRFCGSDVSPAGQ